MKKNLTISAVLTKEQIASLDAIADEEQASRCCIIRQAVREFLHAREYAKTRTAKKEQL